MAHPLLAARPMLRPRPSRFVPLAALAALATLAMPACSSSEPSLAGGDAAVDAPASDAPASDAPASDAPASDADPASPTLFFHVRANAAPFAHADGLAGQTSRNTKQGIRKLRIYRDAADTSPVTVFDHGKGFVEAGYDAGDDTTVGSAPFSSIPPARYTLARITVTHSIFQVDATLHAAGGAFPGTFDCVQTLSDGVTLDGASRAKGWYRYVFTTAGTAYPQEGTGAPLPTTPGTGGFTLKTEGGESFYEMPIDLTVEPVVSRDLHLKVEVNMDRAFRWEDQSLAGFAPGVFDTTPTSFEPIRRFGANAYTVTLE